MFKRNWKNHLPSFRARLPEPWRLVSDALRFDIFISISRAPEMIKSQKHSGTGRKTRDGGEGLQPQKGEIREERYLRREEQLVSDQRAESSECERVGNKKTGVIEKGGTGSQSIF
jgi:hypothetical protein